MQLEAMGLNMIIYSSPVPVGDGIGISEALGTAQGIPREFWQGKAFFSCLPLGKGQGGAETPLENTTENPELQLPVWGPPFPPLQSEQGASRGRGTVTAAVSSCKQPMCPAGITQHGCSNGCCSRFSSALEKSLIFSQTCECVIKDSEHSRINCSSIFNM